MLFGQRPERAMTCGDLGHLRHALLVGPLVLSGSELRGSRWPLWLAYFGMLGAGFMMIEVALLQRFVLLLGHPVYSLTSRCFRCCWGGIGSLISRRIADDRLRGTVTLIMWRWSPSAILGIVALHPSSGRPSAPAVAPDCPDGHAITRRGC